MDHAYKYMNIFVSPLLYITVYVPWSINKLFLFLCIFLAAEKRFPLCFFIVFFASLCVQYSPVCERTYPCNIMACILLQGVLSKSNQVTKDPNVTTKNRGFCHHICIILISRTTAFWVGLFKEQPKLK